MKQFFEEYGGVIMVLVVVVALIGIVGTDSTKGLSKTVSTALSGSVQTFIDQVSFGE